MRERIVLTDYPRDFPWQPGVAFQIRPPITRFDAPRPKPILFIVDEVIGKNKEGDVILMVNRAAQKLGKRGGKARAKKLTAEQRKAIARKAGKASGKRRSEQARKAVEARWKRDKKS